MWTAKCPNRRLKIHEIEGVMYYNIRSIRRTVHNAAIVGRLLRPILQKIKIRNIWLKNEEHIIHNGELNPRSPKPLILNDGSLFKAIFI